MARLKPQSLRNAYAGFKAARDETRAKGRFFVSGGRERGTVRLVHARGFGFVVPDGGGEDVFIPQTAMPPGGLEAGARIEFTRVPSLNKPGGWVAFLLRREGD
jgi:cold shock CspA family protein